MIWERNGGNITFISKRKEYDCNYFCLLISRINKYGDSGLNYLCPGYYHYYQHVAPYMDYMKQELMSQRPPSNIMKVVQ